MPKIKAGMLQYVATKTNRDCNMDNFKEEKSFAQGEAHLGKDFRGRPILAKEASLTRIIFTHALTKFICGHHLLL